MKNINKIVRVITALAVAMSFAGCSNSTAGQGDASQSFNVTASDDGTSVPIDDASIASTAEAVTTDSPSLSDDESSADPALETEYAPVLSNGETLKAVAATIDSATGFLMTCRIKGSIPDSKSKPLLIEHEYTYAVTKDTTYLKSSYQDLNNDAQPVTYEEYRTVEDNILSTITKNGDEWVCNASKEMQRNDMLNDTVSSIALLRFFDTRYTFKNTDTVSLVPITRCEDGSIMMTFPVWSKWVTSDEELRAHPFAGLIRFPERTGELHNVTLESANGNVAYTLNADYSLKAIDADIVSDNGYDLHVTIRFSDWNNVLPIIVPPYTSAQLTAE